MSILKKMKPNKLSVVKEQIKGYADKVSFPEFLNEAEKDLYHVLLVEGKLNQSTLEVNYKANVQMYDKISWQNTKTKLQQLGYTNAFIIHNPMMPLEFEEEEKIILERLDSSEGVEKTMIEEKKEIVKELIKTENKDKGYRKDLIQKAIDLGFEGKQNLKSEIYEDFIKDVENND